jgi:flagellar export protein FliJ
MKTLATLIKLHRRRLDELRRQMGALENQKAQLLQTSQRLQEELREEINKASQQPEMGHFFGGFAKRIQQRQEDIAEEVRSLDKQMQKLNDEIAEAYTDVKKYEIAEQNAKERAKQEALRKENIMLDELAQQQHRRHTTEEQ